MPSRSFFASPEGLQQLEAAKGNLSFAAIAKQAGVSADTVSRLFHPERGKGLSESSLYKIATALGLNGDTLLVQADDTADNEAFATAEQSIREALEENSTSLDLSGLELKAVPVAIGQLQNLTELSLYHNQLTQVPPELGQLQNLTELSLSHNQLTQVPPELGQLQNLTELSLSHNQLTQVPPELGQLQNLTRLYHYHHQLTPVPPALGQLQ
ncbi:MAG: hypothetical protein F6K11_16400, partial [Leptolyngbya sp. SIO3F4]|nr:hypothetical protein [Leptolyngbya sp. SIO3F4]